MSLSVRTSVSLHWKKFLSVLLVLGMATLLYKLHQKTWYYTHAPYATVQPFPAPPHTSTVHLQTQDKIWLHRVNSVERATHFLHEYNGFEIDIYYNPDQNNFNVDHDNQDFHTTLQDMLTVFRDREKIGLWLDFKNLSEHNKTASCARLTQLLETFDIDKSRVIVESPNINALTFFVSKGFVTSYYFVPPKENTPENLSKIQKFFYDSGISCISTDLVHYDILNRFFPNVPWLFWDLKSYSRKVLAYSATCIRKHILSENPHVRVLLVGDKTLWR